jgi:hypothetical protein
MASECHSSHPTAWSSLSSERCNLFDARKVFDEMRKEKDGFVELHGFWIFRRDIKWRSKLSCLMTQFQAGHHLGHAHATSQLNSSSISQDPLFVACYALVWRI